MVSNDNCLRTWPMPDDGSIVEVITARIPWLGFLEECWMPQPMRRWLFPTVTYVAKVGEWNETTV